jgi:hypothetical protein
MSLVPFMRHGSIFSGYVLDKLADVIASRPRPTDAKSRKAFATLKVHFHNRLAFCVVCSSNAWGFSFRFSAHVHHPIWQKNAITVCTSRYGRLDESKGSCS